MVEIKPPERKVFSSKEVEASSYLRLMVLGGPKVGKTYTVISTAPGKKYVINCDDKYSLKPAARVAEFDWSLALGDDSATTNPMIDTCIKEARLGVKEGRYDTIIVDTLTKYAARSVESFAAATANKAGESDGRRFWRMHNKHLHNIIDRLFMLKAHVIVNCHWAEESAQIIDGQLKKSGSGIVPGFEGKSRQTIPAEFQDVVFLEKAQGGKRVFVTNSDGVWGPGCRNLTERGYTSLDADVTKLWELMKSQGGTELKQTEQKKQKEKANAVG